MNVQSRRTFLQALGSLIALPAALPLARKPSHWEGYDFVARGTSDAGAAPMWHAYPDECYAYTTFADSLVALAGGQGWYMQPPIVGIRNAIVVDFASRTEDDAEASIADGWCGCWEYPMGTVATTRDRIERGQNTRASRHLALIATGMLPDDFHTKVVEQLIDAQTCPTPKCKLCADRPTRHLADVFKIFAAGADQDEVQLFSAWKPSEKLVADLEAEGTLLAHQPLSAIPAPDLEANRHYHYWSGTPLQAEEFRKTVWAPKWKARALGLPA